MTAPLITVEGLSLAYRQGPSWQQVVTDVSFQIAPGEVLGLVGESGCGKSTVALQLLGYRHPALRVVAGRVALHGRTLTGLPRPELDRLRGRRISFVPQNPTTALNPGIRVGAQVGEMRATHGADGRDTATLFALVGLPADAGFGRRYPHQLSGGQQQRVCIAMALACNPDLVVLDEPTTGLDVTTQAQIVTLLADLRARLGMSMVYVTHDLTLLSQIADRVGVMYAGRMVEIAPTATLFQSPRHPYTQGLIASIPGATGDGRAAGRPLPGLLRREDIPPGCPFQPRCAHARPDCAVTVQPMLTIGAEHAVACFRWDDLPPPMAEFAAPHQTDPRPAVTVLSVQGLNVAYGRAEPVVRDVSLTLAAGETLALVGESGSGKSTLARAISGLIAPGAGRIALRGVALAPQVRARSDEQRRLVQLVFQNPDASLNPRARIGRILQRPLDCFFPAETADSAQQVAQAIASVRLEPAHARRYPDQMSGGERQRVAIARALLARPDILLCDEVLSALDVSVQASILDLLQRLKRERGISMLFISHDLAVVRLVADRIAVLFRGEVVETGPTADVFAPPHHPYTHALLQSVPRPLQRPLPVATRPAGPASASGVGCAYAARCAWKAGAICDTTRPPWQETPQGLRLRCHLPLPELTKLAEQSAQGTRNEDRSR